MTRLTQLVDAFWGCDFISTSGFDGLCRRMKVGRSTCKEIADFLSQRSKIEQEYSKNLQRLAKSVQIRGLDESHTLQKAWTRLVDEMEGIASVHDEAFQQYKLEAERLHTFHEKQKEEKKKMEEGMKKQQSNKISLYHKTINLQKVYFNKCREKDAAKTSWDLTKNSVTAQAKDVEKLKVRFEKCGQSAEQADMAYKNSVDLLDQGRILWEREMEDLCINFQKLEEQRIDFLRQELWLLANIASKVCVDVDESCENVRRTLEKCDVAADIMEFIGKNKTGTDRPAKLEYSNYYSSNTSGPDTDTEYSYAGIDRPVETASPSTVIGKPRK